TQLHFAACIDERAGAGVFFTQREIASEGETNPQGIDTAWTLADRIALLDAALVVLEPLRQETVIELDASAVRGDRSRAQLTQISETTEAHGAQRELPFRADAIRTRRARKH